MTPIFSIIIETWNVRVWCAKRKITWNDTFSVKLLQYVVNTFYFQFLGKYRRVLTVLQRTCDGSWGISSKVHRFILRQEKTLWCILFISIPIQKLGGIWGWVGLTGGIKKNRYFVLWAHVCFSSIFLAGSGEWHVKPCVTFL